MNVLNLTTDQFLECQNLFEGVLKPVSNFMDEAQFYSVVENMQLLTGEIYTIPIVLDVTKDKARELSYDTKVELHYQNEVIGFLYPDSFFVCDRQKSADKIFGTSKISHPGVLNFMNLEEVFVGGKVELVKSPEERFLYGGMTPKRTSKLFEEKGWNKIVGFQTRNIPHRAHEYLLRVALESSDGLFIQPLIGKKKKGDFTSEAILAGYRKLASEFLPTERVVVGTLSTKMRYAGPREAIFHAQIRKNYGCTDFIIGRDQAGVGNWYGKYEAQQLAKSLEGRLGIRILALKGPYYCSKCEGIVTENSCSIQHAKFSHEISGTDIRRILSTGDLPDSRFFRPEILQALKGMALFIE